MTSSKNNGFTAGDIERYHSGKMLPEERHALEKAALDDPFLADALEGYAFTSTPAADLASIQSRLKEKQDRKKVIPLFQKYKWLSVAAILLVIAGAGWLTYTISEKETAAPVAVHKEGKSTETTSTPPQLSNPLDSSANSSDRLVNNTSPVTKQNKELREYKKEKTTKTNDLVVRDVKDAIGSDLTKNEAVSKARKPSDQNEVASVNAPVANTQMSEVTINRALTSAPYAKASSAQREQAIAKDSNRDNANLNGRRSGINPNDTIKNFNVVLQPQHMDSADMVIIGYGVQKKSPVNYPKVIIDTLEPAEGYTDFDSYVASNLKPPDEIKSKTISGEVQLSFDVDENGKPVNIAVVKSLCQKCDEEAVRLLKEGPKWKKKKNKKGKLTIRF
jgi:TonB family protein